MQTLTVENEYNIAVISFWVDYCNRLVERREQTDTSIRRIQSNFPPRRLPRMRMCGRWNSLESVSIDFEWGMYSALVDLQDNVFGLICTCTGNDVVFSPGTF